jgi:hypothetical protein
VKGVSEFHRSARYGSQAWYKPCRREYDAAYHRANRERRALQKKRQLQDFIRWYRTLKDGKPCTDCGGVFHHAAMQWDHLPGSEKLENLGNLRGKRSRRLVLEEIAKCELVCANCHAIRTFVRHGA